MNYKYIIFDVDDTLLDYTYAQSNAFIQTMRACNIEYNSEFMEQFNQLCFKEWDQYGLNNTEDKYIQENYHGLYHQYSISKFEKLKNIRKIDMSSEELNELYTAFYRKINKVNQFGLKVCHELSKHKKLMIATNGLTTIQTSRISKLKKYFSKVFISEEVGFIKPTTDFFQHILETNHSAEKNEFLMVGDSLISDIKGASLVGMDTCWYNPRKQVNRVDVKPTYEIHNLNELLRMIPASK